MGLSEKKSTHHTHIRTHTHASILHSQYWTSWSKRQLIVKIWGQCPTLILCIFMRLGQLQRLKALSFGRLFSC